MKPEQCKTGARVRVLKDGFWYKAGDTGVIADDTILRNRMLKNNIPVVFETEKPFIGGVVRSKKTVWVPAEDIEPEKKPHAAGSVKEDKETVRRPRRIVFEITNDGGKARYVNDNKIVREAEVRRAHSDEPDDPTAAIYLIAKLFPECEIKVSADAKDEKDDRTRTYPEIDGFACFSYVNGNPVYIDPYQVVSVQYGKTTEEKTCIVVSTVEDTYHIKGDSVEDVVRKITEARGK